MDIHRYEKIWIGISLLFVLGLIATVTYGAVGAGVKTIGNQGGTVNPNDLQNTPFGNPGVRKVGPNHYAVYVVARQFYYQPGTGKPITVPAGSDVTFYVTSADVIHGFEVVDTNINSMAIPGEVSKFTVHFDKPAKYGIICNEYCGVGHGSMQGRLNVVPQSQFNLTEANQ